MPVSWVSGSNGKFPAGAIGGGHEASGEVTYVVRASERSDVCPGKLTPTHGHAYVSYAGKEVQKPAYEVLVGDMDSLEWVPAAGGSVPPNAVPGGKTSAQETLYIGRTHKDSALVCGKIHPSNKVLYFPYGGKELNSSTYECLVEKPKPAPVVTPQPIYIERIRVVEPQRIIFVQEIRHTTQTSGPGIPPGSG